MEETVSILLSKLSSCPGVVAHSCDLSSQDVEEGEITSWKKFNEFKTSLDYLEKHS